MRATDAYGELLALGRPIVTTREAAARWRVEQRTAGRRLRSLEEGGFARRLRRGLWALDSDPDPLAVPPYLTAPFPAYVSLWTALSRHGMIEQIPRRHSVVSLDRTRRVETSVGDYAIHHIAPELFGGFLGLEGEVYMATPEKALFDLVYLRAAAGSRAYLTELALSPGFDRGQTDEWTARIDHARLRTMVARRLRELLQGAVS